MVSICGNGSFVQVLLATCWIFKQWIPSLAAILAGRPIRSAQTGALLSKKITQTDFTPKIIHALLVCAVLSPNKDVPKYQPLPLKATYLRGWLQLWWTYRPVHRCFAGEEEDKKSGHAFSSNYNAREHNRLLTYGCTVRRYDLQAQYTSQVEQPHRHLLSNARWHCC